MLFDKTVSCVYENGKRITMLSLSVPLFFEGIFLLLYNTVNTIILSNYSELYVSAINVCVQIANIAICIVQMFIKGTVVISSVSFGAKNYDRAAKIAFNGLIMVIFFSITCSLVLFFKTECLCTLMGLCGEVKYIAIDYLKVYALFFVFLSTYSLFNNLLICNGYSRYSMIIGVTSNILNALLTYLFLHTESFYGFSKIIGIALIGGIMQVLCVIISILIYAFKHCPFKIAFNCNLILNIFKLGIPAGMSIVLFSLSQTITSGFIVALGITFFNAKVYISNILGYISKGSLAVGQAGGVLIGRYKGSCEYDKILKLFKQNIIISVMLNFFLSLLCFVFHKNLLRLFTNDKQIIKLAAVIFLIDIILEIFRGVNHVCEHALNACGDVKFTFTVSVVSCWFICVFMAYCFGITFGFGLVGIWIAFIFDEVFRGVLYIIRLKRGKWKKINI